MDGNQDHSSRSELACNAFQWAKWWMLTSSHFEFATSPCVASWTCGGSTLWHPFPLPREINATARRWEKAFVWLRIAPKIDRGRLFAHRTWSCRPDPHLHTDIPSCQVSAHVIINYSQCICCQITITLNTLESDLEIALNWAYPNVKRHKKNKHIIFWNVSLFMVKICGIICST